MEMQHDEWLDALASCVDTPWTPMQGVQIGRTGYCQNCARHLEKDHTKDDARSFYHENTHCAVCGCFIAIGE